MPKGLLLFCVAASLIAGQSVAQTQPFKPVGKSAEWTLDLGGGPVYGFNASGGETDKVNFTAWGSFTWRDRLFANGLDGVGYNLISREKLKAGVELRPRYAAGSSIDGLDLPGFGADVAGYAYTRVGENFSVGGRLQHDATGETKGTSLWLSASHQDITPVGLLQSTLYTNFGDRNFNRAYYGIDFGRAQATGYALFEPGAGVQNAGVALLMMTPVSAHYAVGSFINAERTLGDIADSPLVQSAPNKEMRYRAGFIVIRRFGSVLR